jgi:hypothetical protein
VCYNEVCAVAPLTKTVYVTAAPPAPTRVVSDPGPVETVWFTVWGK